MLQIINKAGRRNVIINNISPAGFSKLHINEAPANALLKFLPLGNSPFSLNMKDPD